MRNRSACPASIMIPAGMNPRCRNHESSRTSVSVHTVPSPIDPASASTPTTRSASSRGGSGMRTWTACPSCDLNCGPNRSEMRPAACVSRSRRENARPRDCPGFVEWLSGSLALDDAIMAALAGFITFWIAGKDVAVAQAGPAPSRIPSARWRPSRNCRCAALCWVKWSWWACAICCR